MNGQEEQLKEEITLAQMGQQVVNNHIYKQAFIARKGQLFDIFCKTKKDQEDVREEAWRTMQNLNALESYFEQVLNTGKMADIKLNELEKFQTK